MYKEDIAVFREMIKETANYDSSHPSIQRVEEFVMSWFNGLDMEQGEEWMDLLIEELKDEFVYKGILYRGMEIEEDTWEQGEKRGYYVTSFTSDREIAESFAGVGYGISKRPGYVSILVKKETKEAFDVTKLLEMMKEVSDNADVEIVWLDRSWEEEKMDWLDWDEVEVWVHKEDGWVVERNRVNE